MSRIEMSAGLERKRTKEGKKEAGAISSITAKASSFSCLFGKENTLMYISRWLCKRKQLGYNIRKTNITKVTHS